MWLKSRRLSEFEGDFELSWKSDESVDIRFYIPREADVELLQNSCEEEEDLPLTDGLT